MAASTEATEKRKPVTVVYRQKTKCKVDAADLMARQYFVKAGTCRWPVAIFYEILTRILYKEQTIEKFLE